jgi:hypothetical protein
MAKGIVRTSLSKAEVEAYLHKVPLKAVLEAGLEAALAERTQNPAHFLASFYSKSACSDTCCSRIVQLIESLDPLSVSTESLDALDAAVVSLRGASGRAAGLAAPKRSLLRADHVEVGDNLGLGAFGAVFAGRWRGIDIALKFINQPAPRDAIDLLLAESDLMESLDHRNLMRVYGVCVEAPPGCPLPPPCICGELLEHGTLIDYVRRHEAARGTELAFWQQLCTMLHGAASGLAYLHENNVIQCVDRVQLLCTPDALLFTPYARQPANHASSRTPHLTDGACIHLACAAAT